MSLFWRYNLALVGGFLAMSAHIFLAASRNIWFTPQHLGSAIAAGLMFGHVVAIMVVLVRDAPAALRDRLPAQLVWLIAFIGGVMMGTLGWWVHITFILYQTKPNILVLLIGGVGLSLGFVVSAIVTYRPTNIIRRIVLYIGLSLSTALAIYLPIYFTYQNYLQTLYNPLPAQALLYFQADNPEHVWFIGIPFALTIACFGQLPVLFQTRLSTSSSHPAEP